jgi:hypothetical protein
MVDYFKCMYSELLPPELFDVYNLICEILEIHKTKRMYLPRSALKSFYYTDSILSEPSVQKLKEEIKSGNKPYFKMATNMMQGILHFTSSLYHCAHLEVLKRKLEEEFNQYDPLIEFQVSSDDEGILVTLGSDDHRDLEEACRRFLKRFKTIKHSVDLKFGVRTSWEKSTLTHRDIYEFNSKFLFGNSLATPLIKFTLRSLYDHPSESLHARVSSLYSEVAEVRDQGGSGYLCSAIEHLQSLCIRRNLGSQCSWWDSFSTYFNKSCRLSFTGRHFILPPQTSGFGSSKYHDYINCLDDNESRKLYSSIGIRNTSYYHKDLDVQMRFTLFPRRIYIKKLRECGLEPNLKINREQWSTYLRKRADTIHDYEVLMASYVSSPGIAKSFSQLNRTDVTRSSVYIAYTPMFSQSESELKSLGSIYDLNLMDNEIENLFPGYRDYDRLKFLSSRVVSVDERMPNLATNKIWVYPFGPSNSIMRDWRPVLLAMWFGEDNSSETSVLFPRFQNLFPWLSTSPEESLKDSPFETFEEMVSFFESWSRGVKTRALYAIGKGTRIKDLAEVIPYNTIPGMRIGLHESTMSVDDPGKFEYDFESRMTSWNVLLRMSTGAQTEKLKDAAISDLMEVLPDYPLREVISTQGGFHSRSSFALSLMLLRGKITFQEYIENHNGTLNLYIKPQEKVSKTYVGFGHMILKRGNRMVEVTVQDNICLTVRSSQLDWWIEYLPMKNLMIGPRTVLISEKPRVPSPKEIYLTYVDGFRVGFDEGYTQVFSMPPNGMSNSFQTSTGDKYLQKWLRQSRFQLNDILAFLNSAFWRPIFTKMVRSCLTTRGVTITAEGSAHQSPINLSSESELEEEDLVKMSEEIFDLYAIDDEDVDESSDLETAKEFEQEYHHVINDFNFVTPMDTAILQGSLDKEPGNLFYHGSLRSILSELNSARHHARVKECFGDLLAYSDSEDEAMGLL